MTNLELYGSHGQMDSLKLKNEKLGTQLRFFLYETPENWSHQICLFAIAHRNQPLSHLNVPPQELVFHIEH